MEWWEATKDWFLSLGEKYNVNPIVFGSIYVGAIPFFFASLTWLIKRLRKGKPIVLQVLLTCFFFISAYLYLIIAGKNIPAWVYLFIGAMVIYGIASTVKKVRDRIK
jgi:glycopeptide antibiotics resistance protein